MRSSRLKLALFLLISCPTFAYEVLRVIPGDGNYLAVSNTADSNWRLNEGVCVFRKKAKIGCGQVIRITRVGMILTLDQVSQTLFAGQAIDITPTERSTAAQRSNLGIVGSKFEGFYDSKSVVFGVNMFSPYIRIEDMAVGWLSVGFMATYNFGIPAGSGALTGPGLFATLGLYPMGPYTGAFGLLAVGGAALNAVNPLGEEKVLSITAGASAGWRWRWESGFNVGLSAGAQYYYLPNLRTIDLGFMGLSPTVTADLGITF